MFILALILAQAPVCYSHGGSPRCFYEGNRVQHGEHVARAGGRPAPTGASEAFFEFANSGGTGVGAACACAAVTGSKGEVITHTRASSAYCSKVGAASTGIANGDYVSCGNNLPRVESDGTVNGLRMEEARTNRLLHSNTVGINSPWFTSSGGGAAAPTITAAYAVGPDGVAGSATRLQNPACPSGQYSIIYQNYTQTTGTPQVGFVFVKGTSGSGSIGLYLYANSGLLGQQISCSYNSSTWTWCGGPAARLVYTSASGSMQLGIGCTTSGIPGNSNTGASDALLWGANAQLGAFPTSPITTTIAAATRAGDTNALNASTFPGSPFSVSGYLTPLAPSGVGAVNGILEGLVGTATGAGLFNSGGNFRLSTNNGSNAFVQGVPTVVAGTTYKVGGVNSAGSSTVYFNGSVLAGPTVSNDAGTPWSTSTGVGYAPAGGAGWQANGIVSRLCVDSSTTKCVP